MTGKYRRLGCALLTVCCLGAGLGAAATGGNSEDPVSLSYLTGTFLSTLKEGITSRAQKGTKDVLDDALAQVDEVGARHSGDGSWTVTQAPLLAALKGGDTLTLDEGGSLLWLAGAGTGTGLVDATAGTVLPANGKLTAGHRYLNGWEGTSAVVTVDSDAAQAAPAGRWTTVSGGRDVTNFYDLSQTDWFYDGVRWTINQGLFGGVSTTQFDPYGTLNRAMVVTLLHRLSGSPATVYRGLFTDVPQGQWYTQAAEWAAAAGITQGNGDGTFSPTRPAGREELVTMLCRCAGYLGLNTSPSASLEDFTDSAAVSPYAREAMSWAVGADIIQGSDGSLLPQTTVTRAQTALILQRFQTWRNRT